jgi:hypothetical protein
MSAGWIAVPVQLWRGELRVQGLLLRRGLFTALQAAVGLVFFAVVAARVHDALARGGPLPVLNLAIATVAFGMLLAANVTLLGERTGTLPWQIQSWSASLPLASGSVARLIVAFSLLRSGLLTLALLSAVAVGALTAAHSLTGVVMILASALLLPLLPVALGLQWARWRGASVSLAFTIVPIGVTVAALSVQLPATSGWIATALRLIALPALLLTGRAAWSEAIVFLAVWVGLATLLMRPAALSLKDSAVGRGFDSSIRRLSGVTAHDNPNRLALDIVIHRVGLADVLEVVFLGMVSCSVVALQTFVKDSVVGGIAMTAAFSAAAATAALAGYLDFSATVRTDPATEAWIRTLPVSARALALARHGVCVAAAALAVVPVMVLAIVKAGLPPETGAIVLALWAGMTALALTGWFAAVLSVHGWRRKVAGYGLFAWFSIRSIAGAAVLVAWNRPLLVAALFAVDVVIALAGQWLGTISASREPAQ